jgi:hypothetical protein
MSLLDKMKSAAQDAATAAKKGAAQVKDKAGDTMLRRKADEAAKQIGYLVYKERTGGESVGAEVDRLIGEIASFEAQIAAGPATDDGGASATPEPEAPAPASEPPPTASEPAAGDFKLE